MFANGKLHGSGFFFAAIVLAQEFVADRFHLDGQRLHFLVVIAPGDQRRDGNQKPHQGRVQGDGDAFGQNGVVGQPFPAQVAKQGDQGP